MEKIYGLRAYLSVTLQEQLEWPIDPSDEIKGELNKQLVEELTKHLAEDTLPVSYQEELKPNGDKVFVATIYLIERR